MKKLLYWVARWRESADPHIGLDSLLARARPDLPAEERLEWLRDLSAWLRAENQTVRLRHLLGLLDRNPERKSAFAATLRATLADRDAFDLLTETGLPREAGFFGEFSNRLIVKLLPEPPPADLAALFVRVFPSRENATTLEAIDDEVWTAALAVFDHGADVDGVGYRRRIAGSAENALEALAMQVAATTLAKVLRERMEETPDEPLPTLTLPFAVDRFIQARRSRDAARIEADREALHRELGAALLSVEKAYRHLNERGVSIGIVYQLERVCAQLQRMGELTDLLGDAAKGRTMLRHFLANLIRDVHDHRSVRALLAQSFALVSRKIVERNAEAGEHYIARDRGEYAGMLRSALGGGALTALTVYLKFAVSSIKMPSFFDGFLASINYSLSFVAIQLAGFTLATKQPAMTAPALAQKMHGVDEPAKMEALVDEVADLVRSQSAAIFGNLLGVAPMAIAVFFFFSKVLGVTPLAPEKALKTIDALSIWGPTLLFAAFTGVLLWLSSVIAGWVENWFVYRELGPAVAAHRRLRYVFGPTGAQRIATFFERQIAGLAGNVSLGFLLGSAPVFLAFYGLPIDVRHVTLSTGQLAASVCALGFESMLRPGFWLAVAGIAGIAALNLGVSFALALNVAIRARGISDRVRWLVYRAIARRMATHPGEFLFPPKARSQVAAG